MKGQDVRIIAILVPRRPVFTSVLTVPNVSLQGHFDGYTGRGGQVGVSFSYFSTQ